MIETGHVEPWWNQQHLYLNYVDTQFNNKDDLIRWGKDGFLLHDHVGGVYMLQRENTIWEDLFFTKFNGKNVGVTAFKMRPGFFIPGHCDSYSFYKMKNNITNLSQIKRAVIFLEDWKSGHFLEVDNTPIVDWKAGDYVIWQGDTHHLAANLGSKDRYTAQITFTYD